MERPQTHIMRTKVSSCPNHMEAYGPKIANRVSKTQLLFLKTESLRLDIQLESTWDVGMNINRAFKGRDINRAFKGRDINRVSKTRFSSGLHEEKRWLKSDKNMKTEFLRLDLQALNRVFQTRDVSMKYTFKTMPTNYIVWQT